MIWPSRGARLVATAGIVLGLLGTTACSDDQDDPHQLDDWQAVVLPADMVPASMVLRHDSLLVGGSRAVGADRTPALASLAVNGHETRATVVPLTPATPYGKRADLVSLTSSGDQVVAVGAAHGGAHANFRWTIWTGSASGVIDRPQAFETFGGWEAGTLLGLATDSRGPLVVGTWQGAHGPDGTVWRQSGQRWVRQPVTTALTNAAERQVAPQTVDQQHDGSVTVSGSVIDLGAGVQQSAAYWRDVGGSWSRTVLSDPGRRSTAWSTACSATCWSVGARDGQLAVWSGTGRETVPSTPAVDADSGRVLLSGDRAVIAASSHGAGRLLLGRKGRWRSYTGPAGRIRAAQLIGSRLVIISEGQPSGVWERDIADLLGR